MLLERTKPGRYGSRNQLEVSQHDRLPGREDSEAAVVLDEARLPEIAGILAQEAGGAASPSRR